MNETLLPSVPVMTTVNTSSTTMVETGNLTYDPKPAPVYDDEMEIAYESVMRGIGIATTAVATIAVVENIIALVLLGRRSNSVIRERRGFTISLALADAMVGLGWIVFFTVLRCHVTAGKLIHYLSYFRMSMSTAGLWSLFALVLDRFLVVRNPFNPDCIRKVHVPWICVGIWLVSIAVNFSNLATEHYILTVVLMVVPRLPACFGIIFLYLMIHWIAFKSRQRMTRNRGDNRFEPVGAGSWTTQMREAKRSVFLFTLVCLIYIFGLVTRVSLHIVQMKRCGFLCILEENYGINIAQESAITICIASSALNPWIHTFRRRALGRRLSRLLSQGETKKSNFTERSSLDKGRTDIPLV